MQEKIKNYTNSQLARATGVSNATISLWRAGKYTGDTKKIEAKVQEFIDIQELRATKSKREIATVETSAFISCQQLLSFCHRDGDMGVIVGGAGMGKTVALKAFAQKNTTAILLEIDPTWTKKVVLRKLVATLGGDEGLNINQMMDFCVGKLQGSGRIILVDEAEYLDTNSLELLRRIHDFAGVAIVLSGLPRLLSNLRGRRGELRQLYSRLGIKRELGESLADKDISLMLTELLPTADISVDVVRKATHGVARHISKLTRLITSVAGDEAITDSTVADCAQMLVV